MSQTWMEDLESEVYESNGEADYGSESSGEADYEDFGEDARSDARRARQQRIMLERRRMMLERQQREAGLRRPPALPRGPMPPPGAARAPGPSPRQTLRAIRHLDLETKMELDSLRRQLKESNRRASRGNWATVAGIATAEIINQFDALENHPNVSAAILAAPLLLLSPERQRSGIEGFLLDPRVIGGAAVVGIAAASRFTSTSKAVHSITIGAPPTLTLGSKAITGGLTAAAFDRNGNLLPGTQFTWNSSPNDQLTVAPGPSAQTTYTLAPATTPAQEQVQITAQADGITGLVFVTVLTGS